MSYTDYPNGVTSFGAPIVPSTSPKVVTGTVFFVDSNTGSDTGPSGKSKDLPFATIDYAVGKCTANKGDVIYVMPGHAESITTAGAIAVDVAGVSIIGIGNGSLRPTISFGAAAATIAVSAANCRFENLIFNANFADVAVGIVVTGTDLTVQGCLFKEAGANLNWLSCIETGTTNDGADGLTILNNERISVDAEALAFISILANTARLKVIGNFDQHTSAADVGHFIIMAAKVCLAAQINYNVLALTGDQSANTVGLFATGSSITSTGVMAHNLVGSLDATTELFCTATLDFWQFENLVTGTIAASGRVLPAVDT